MPKKDTTQDSALIDKLLKLAKKRDGAADAADELTDAAARKAKMESGPFFWKLLRTGALPIESMPYLTSWGSREGSTVEDAITLFRRPVAKEPAEAQYPYLLDGWPDAYDTLALRHMVKEGDALAAEIKTFSPACRRAFQSVLVRVGRLPRAEISGDLVSDVARRYVRGRYPLGEPLWLQDPQDGAGAFVLQFDENLVDTNLGDSGVMYVFADNAFWQCH